MFPFNWHLTETFPRMIMDKMSSDVSIIERSNPADKRLQAREPKLKKKKKKKKRALFASTVPSFMWDGWLDLTDKYPVKYSQLITTVSIPACSSIQTTIVLQFRRQQWSLCGGVVSPLQPASQSRWPTFLFWYWTIELLKIRWMRRDRIENYSIRLSYFIARDFLIQPIK